MDLTYRARTGLHSVDVDGEVLIWDASAEQLHRLNQSASQVWLELATWRSISEVVARLSTHVDEAAPSIASDVASCIEELARCQLLDQKVGVTQV
jgi:hypothetical protein